MEGTNKGTLQCKVYNVIIMLNLFSKFGRLAANSVITFEKKEVCYLLF